ncbi:hypothetical protein D3C87_1726470 [compost metagenome]
MWGYGLQRTGQPSGSLACPERSRRAVRLAGIGLGRVVGVARDLGRDVLAGGKVVLALEVEREHEFPRCARDRGGQELDRGNDDLDLVRGRAG